MIADALKTREGTIFLASAGLVLVLDALLLISTVNAIQHQDTMSEAVGLYYRNEGKAKQALLKLRDQGATAKELLAGWYYERAKDEAGLETARKLYNEALAVEPGRTSAAVGLAAVTLRLAEGKNAKGRKAAADEAESALRQANDDQHPDVRAMKGAIALMRGKPKQALELLSKEPETAPSLEGESARWWNLGVAKLLMHEGDAFRAMGLGFSLRRWPIPDELSKRAKDAEEQDGRRLDGERLLVAAYRMATADPDAKPDDAAARTQRCEQVDQMVKLAFTGGAGLRGGQRGRFLPHLAEMPPVYNALGLGYFKVERYADAARMFALACDATRREEPLYLLNEAECAYRAGIAQKEGTPERKKLLTQAAQAFDTIVKLLKGQKGRAQQVKLALVNVAAIYGKLGNWRRARDYMQRSKRDYPSETEWERHMGVLWDHTDDRRCVKFYRKAIKGGHPDDVAMQQRIRYWAGRR